MRNAIKKVIFVAFAFAAWASQAVAQDNQNNNMVVLVGTSNAEGQTDQYMVSMNDGSVFHNRGDEDAEFVGKFDAEELAAIQQELGQLQYKNAAMVHKDGKPYHYLIIMGNGEEYSLSWNEKGNSAEQNFYMHVQNRCSLLRSDYSIAY